MDLTVEKKSRSKTLYNIVVDPEINNLLSLLTQFEGSPQAKNKLAKFENIFNYILTTVPFLTEDFIKGKLSPRKNNTVILVSQLSPGVVMRNWFLIDEKTKEVLLIDTELRFHINRCERYHFGYDRVNKINTNSRYQSIDDKNKVSHPQR